MSDCVRCADYGDAGGEILSCINAPIDAFGVWTLALDATDQEIGLAWTSLDSQGKVGLHFARFAPDLSLIEQRLLLDLACPGQLALAARPGGWSVAVDSGSGMHLLALDATGQITTDVAFADKIGVQPMLAKREGGDPLLLWIPPVTRGGPSAIKTALVASGGTMLGPESSITFPGEIKPGLPSGWGSVVAVGAGWMVALRAGSNATDTIYIASLSAAGAQVGPLHTPVGVNSEYPSLAVAGAEARMSFSRFGDTDRGMYLVPLTTDGASTSPAQKVGAWQMGFYGFAPIAIKGSDTLILHTPERESLDLVHLYDGDAAAPIARTIATDSILTKMLTRRGSDVILAWINGNPLDRFGTRSAPMGIGMARIAP